MSFTVLFRVYRARNEENSDMQLSLIIPVYNNASSLEELTRRIATTLDSLDIDYEVVLANDGSRDDSWVVIQRLSAVQPRILALNLSRNFGQHAAIKAALTYASGQQMVLMDADLEDHPENIPRLLDAMTPGIDAVYTTVGEARQRISSGLFHRMSNSILRSSVPETVGTFRLFSRKFADAMLQHPERRPVWGPIMHGMGFSHSVVHLHDRIERSTSSYTFLKRARLGLDFLVANTAIPFAVIFLTSLLLFAGTFLYAAVIIIQALFFQSGAPSGVALITFLILVLFGFNFLFMSIIGIYINRLMVEVLQRPVFIVDNVIKRPSIRTEGEEAQNA